MDVEEEGRARVLLGEDLLAATNDARLISIRWDLVPWGVVLDLEHPMSEGTDAAIERAWVLFAGLSEVTWPMVKARVPDGVYLGSGIGSHTLDERLMRFEFSVLQAEYSGNEIVRAYSELVQITANSMRGVVSTTSARPTGEHQTLDRAARLALCSDEEMLRVLIP